MWRRTAARLRNRPLLESWPVALHLAHTKRVARHPSPGAAGPAAGTLSTTLARLAMIATAISKRVETDHVIAYSAKDWVQHGLHWHALTLYLCWLVYVHTSDYSGQPQDVQKEIKNIYSCRGACAMGRPEAEAQVNTKKKGAMAMAQTAAAKAKRDAEKSKAKRGRDNEGVR